MCSSDDFPTVTKHYSAAFTTDPNRVTFSHGGQVIDAFAVVKKGDSESGDAYLDIIPRYAAAK